MGTRWEPDKEAARLAIHLLAVCALFLLALAITTGQAARAQEPGPLVQELAPFLRLTLPGDVTAAGVGLRGAGEGEITLDSLPAGVTVERAFLYWATFGLDGDFTSPDLQGEPVAGELIGRSSDTCWGVPQFPSNYVYRAEVTDRVDGNGVYAVSNLPDDRFAGNDSQGASLVVIYRRPGSNQPHRTVLINDGAVTLDLDTVHTYTTTLGRFSPDQVDAPAQVVYLVGDGQAEFNDGDVTFAGSILDSNAFTGTDGDYWDTLRYDISGLAGGPEAATTLDNRGVGTSPDCLLWAGVVLSVQVEPQDQRVYLPLGLWDVMD